jgi:5-methylcytosine-specific restriction endonuclease McrA
MPYKDPEKRKAHVAANKERIYAANNAWRKANAEKVKLAKKAQYAANREAVCIRNNAYYATNIDKCRIARKVYRDANKEKKRIVDRAYYAANTAKVRAGNKAYYESHLEEAVAYAKAYYAANIEAVKAYAKAQYAANKANVIAAVKVWGAANPEKVKATKAKYSKLNVHRSNARSQIRRVLKLSAIPTWADHSAILVVYQTAADITRSTNIKHEVDHIVPLISKIVCGLHVEFNLQVLTEAANRSKGNRTWPDKP